MTFYDQQQSTIRSAKKEFDLAACLLKILSTPPLMFLFADLIYRQTRNMLPDVQLWKYKLTISKIDFNAGSRNRLFEAGEQAAKEKTQVLRIGSQLLPIFKELLMYRAILSQPAGGVDRGRVPGEKR